MQQGDTIAAISSGATPAPRIILRLGGPQAIPIAHKLAETHPFPDSPGAFHTKITFRRLTIPAWLYIFIEPKSYTGEDLIEFHIPGNPLLAKMLLEELHASGARAAEAGEFTARAYFNGRLDLTEAEGVAATIAAVNEQELSAARRLMSGELARRLAPVIDRVANTLALLEAGIDFSDEEISFLSSTDLLANLSAADELLRQLLDDSVRFERMTHEPAVVLAGRPNAGKSTLLNALAGHRRAVVSPVAGTTRDALSAEIALPRGIVKMIDVAGLDLESPDSSTGAGESPQNQIDRKMREQAFRAIDEADFVIIVQSVADTAPTPTIARDPDLIVITKLDLSPGMADADLWGRGRPRPLSYAEKAGEDARAQDITACDVVNTRPTPSPNRIPVSAMTGSGMDAFRLELDKLCFGASTSSALALNARHAQAIADGRAALARAGAQVNAGPEFVALELREALDALSGITGRISADDLLGRISLRVLHR